MTFEAWCQSQGIYASTTRWLAWRAAQEAMREKAALVAEEYIGGKEVVARRIRDLPIE